MSPPGPSPWVGVPTFPQSPCPLRVPLAAAPTSPVLPPCPPVSPRVPPCPHGVPVSPGGAGAVPARGRGGGGADATERGQGTGAGGTPGAAAEPGPGPATGERGLHPHHAHGDAAPAQETPAVAPGGPWPRPPPPLHPGAGPGAGPGTVVPRECHQHCPHPAGGHRAPPQHCRDPVRTEPEGPQWTINKWQINARACGDTCSGNGQYCHPAMTLTNQGHVLEGTLLPMKLQNLL